MPRPFRARSRRSHPVADREHDDRHTVFAGKRECGRVHDLVVALDRLRMGQTVEPLGGRVLFRIGAVDAVDIGGLQHRLRADFGGAQDRGGIGGEERIAGSTAEQHDATLGEMLCAHGGANRSRRSRGMTNADRVRAGRPRARSRPPAPGSSSRSRACPWCRRSTRDTPGEALRRRERCCRRRPRRRSRRRARGPQSDRRRCGRRSAGRCRDRIGSRRRGTSPESLITTRR